MGFFADLKALFMLLFFSATILLTPYPVSTRNGVVTLKLTKPISAVTPDAALQIDITPMMTVRNHNIPELLRQGEALIPKNTITAILKRTEKDKDGIVISNKGRVSTDGDSVRVSLTGKIPVGEKFTYIKITSQTQLKDVKIYWKNYTK